MKQNKEYFAQKQKEYRNRNPEYRKKWSLMGIKKQIRDRLGNKCIKCGWEGICHIHHIKNDYIRNHYKIGEMNNYRLFCPNCHIKHHQIVGKKRVYDYGYSL